jgi:hypothetical protein
MWPDSRKRHFISTCPIPSRLSREVDKAKTGRQRKDGIVAIHYFDQETKSLSSGSSISLLKSTLASNRSATAIIS